MVVKRTSIIQSSFLTAVFVVSALL